MALLVRRIRRPSPQALAVDVRHVLDLVRRVHGGSAACLVVEDETSTVVATENRPDPTLVQRAEATARLAMNDGRDHVLRADAEIVAVGDGRIGSALVLPFNSAPDTIQGMSADLRRMVAAFRVRIGGSDMLQSDPQRALESALTRLESVEGLGGALCEAARAMADRPTALVLRDEITAGAKVETVSRNADTRLIGCRVTAESAAGRAMMSAVPVVGLNLHELVGVLPGDRRRREDPGIAFPLHDGRQGIGALLVFGQPDQLDGDLRDKLAALAVRLTPSLGAAVAVRTAEVRADTDELTGLHNRRALERAMSQGGDRPAALLMVDADHFKKLNDGFGHAAGDAALKYMGQVFLRTLRDGDIASRIGGEEFALWLNGANGVVAAEVAERVRKALADGKLQWAGADLKLTCSIGVACFPIPVGDIANLRAAADAALYRAKQGGRNRVEFAGR
jgi:diguanylate cyclase (GGDEF)-like protein